MKTRKVVRKTSNAPLMKTRSLQGKPGAAQVQTGVWPLEVVRWSQAHLQPGVCRMANFRRCSLPDGRACSVTFFISPLAYIPSAIRKRSISMLSCIILRLRWQVASAAVGNVPCFRLRAPRRASQRQASPLLVRQVGQLADDRGARDGHPHSRGGVCQAAPPQ